MLPLTAFVADLLATGEVTVASHLTPFAEADVAAATARLRHHHAAEGPHVAHQAPAFEPAAASWAAAALYRAMQLTFLRDYDAVAVAAHLADWPTTVTPAASYSVDLTFRYLPALLAQARHLAPADALVSRLHGLARQWPLSFVGTAPAPAEAPAALLAHPALRALYLDRVIAAQDRARATQPGVAEGVRAALGEYAGQLWSDFPTFTFPAP